MSVRKKGVNDKLKSNPGARSTVISNVSKKPTENLTRTQDIKEFVMKNLNTS